MNSRNRDRQENPSRHIKINIIIFMALAILFAFLPTILLKLWLPDAEQPDYKNRGFSYALYGICPCHEGDDECSNYYACEKDKENIIYNLDNAPDDKIKDAKRDSYFENLIKASNNNIRTLHWTLTRDFCYLLSFLSLVTAVIYGNHNKTKLK